MKIVKEILIYILFFLSTKCLAASYIGLLNGSLTQEFSSIETSGNETKESLSGNSFGIEFGHFLTNSMALELGYSDLAFEIEEVDGTNFTYKSEAKGNFIQYGFRWFLADFFNLRFGINRTQLQPNRTSTGSLEVKNEKIEEVGQYYGAGIGMTFSKTQVFFDWLTFTRTNNKNTTAANVGVKLFF